MALVAARLRPAPRYHTRVVERTWPKDYPDQPTAPDCSRLMWRVACGATFPATGRTEPCAQLLGTAVHASIGVDLEIVETAVRLAQGGVHPPEDAWLLAPYRGHFHKESDGTYRLVSGHRIDDVAGRRHSRLPGLTREHPLYRVIGTPIGRRPMPPALRAVFGDYWRYINADGDRGVLGHYPELPVIVRCPRCSQLNHVERPPDPPGSPDSADRPGAA